MRNNGKVPAVVLIVLFIISLSLAGGAAFLLKKEKAKSQALQEELDDVSAKVKILEGKLDDSKQTAAQLDTQLRDTKTQTEFLSEELKKEKKLSQDTLMELQQVKISLEQQKKLKADTEQKLTQSQADLKKFQAQLKTLEGKKVELENKIKQMEEAKSEKVELGTIVVEQQEEAPALPQSAKTPATTKITPAKAKPSGSSALEGKVLVVNKDYNFVVINLGSRDGVNTNDLFSIYRKNKYIGDIKVEKVHDSMSAANFTSADIKDKVQEGDKVALKNK